MSSSESSGTHSAAASVGAEVAAAVSTGASVTEGSVAAGVPQPAKRAASRRMIILVDGFIMTACMLGARAIDANVMDYAIFGHCGDEGGHRLMLNAMGAEPLLNLGLRLGEGTGAICAFPIVQSAVNMINEMDNFAHASITKYF